jgi:hypothetical protein
MSAERLSEMKTRIPTVALATVAMALSVACGGAPTDDATSDNSAIVVNGVVPPNLSAEDTAAAVSAMLDVQGTAYTLKADLPMEGANGNFKVDVSFRLPKTIKLPHSQTPFSYAVCTLAYQAASDTTDVTLATGETYRIDRVHDLADAKRGPEDKDTAISFQLSVSEVDSSASAGGSPVASMEATCKLAGSAPSGGNVLDP